MKFEFNFEDLANFFWDSKEGLIVLDDKKNIVYSNCLAQKLLGDTVDISEKERQFSFDVCFPREDDILKYNPISAAFNSKEKFKTHALFQVDQNNYKSLLITAFNAEEKKIIIFSDLSDELENIELKKSHFYQINQINKLKQENDQYLKLKERAEAQAIRTGLTNRISALIRDSLDIEEIVGIVISETSRTLAANSGIFAFFDRNSEKFSAAKSWQSNDLAGNTDEKTDIENDFLVKSAIASLTSKVFPDIETGYALNKGIYDNLKQKLAAPVTYQGKILGIMIFFRSNQKKSWHVEEINFVDGIAAQLGAAISQAELFEKIERQKRELESTLLELKETQAQLTQSAKMASLGQLVAGVAHEINTPLGAINSNNDVITKCVKKLKEIEEITPKKASLFDILDEANEINAEAIKRINAIIKSFRNFSRLDEAEFKEVDLHEGIKSSLVLINHETRNRIKVIEEYGELPPVKCYPNLLNQVFMNALINACQSIEGEGTIKIRTGIECNNALVSISDTGKGIREENLSRIFDPGFTTKGVGVGTGLGLSICYKIMEKHNGSIKAESKINEGSTFTIRLPLSKM